MIPGPQAVLWLGEHESRIIRFSAESMSRDRLAGGTGFEEIARRLHDARELVVLGAGERGEDFVRWLLARDPVLAGRVVACWRSEDGSDAHISSIAAAHFLGKTRGGAA